MAIGPAETYPVHLQSMIDPTLVAYLGISDNLDTIGFQNTFKSQAVDLLNQPNSRYFFFKTKNRVGSGFEFIILASERFPDSTVILGLDVINALKRMENEEHLLIYTDLIETEPVYCFIQNVFARFYGGPHYKVTFNLLSQDAPTVGGLVAGTSAILGTLTVA